MRILGIDPGLRVTGYGAVEVNGASVQLIEAGTIVPGDKHPLERRLGALHRELTAVIAATRPDVMVVEELWSAYEHPATAVLMGHARGCIYLAAHGGGVPVRALAHSMVKRMLAGSGAARKSQVKRMVMLQLGLLVEPKPDDVSDALALALALASIDAVEQRANSPLRRAEPA